MPTLHIQLFGEFSARSCEQVVEGLGPRRVQELFCYLLLHRHQRHSREGLASLLWSDVDTAQSKKCLRHVLWQLQTALNQCTDTEALNLLQVEPAAIRINAQADLWVDVDVFEQACTAVKGIAGKNLEAHHIQSLREAVALYQGNLLEGIYEDWCQRERERLQALYLTTLSKLLDYCVTHGEYEEGLLYGADVLKYDQAHEPTHRQLMRLHYQALNRSAALKQYKQCVTALKEEVYAEPDESTQALYQHILEDRGTRRKPAAPAVTPDPSSVTTTSLLSDMLDHLKQIQESQHLLQYRVEQKLAAFEQFLHYKEHDERSAIDQH